LGVCAEHKLPSIEILWITGFPQSSRKDDKKNCAKGCSGIPERLLLIETKKGRIQSIKDNSLLTGKETGVLLKDADLVCRKDYYRLEIEKEGR
jgi:hypothetical protein